MECPICQNELLRHDYFGRILAHQDGHVEGDIYRCEVCNDNGEDVIYYYVYRDDGILKEGYPC